MTKTLSPSPSVNAFAEARCLENQARNLMDSLRTLSPAERVAVRAEARNLYAQAGKVRDNVEEAWARDYLAGVEADGDVPTEFDTRLVSDPEPWTNVAVTVTYVSPVLSDDTFYVVADGADGRGRCIVRCDGQDLAEAQGWLDKDKVRLCGRRTELLGSVGVDIRRVVA
jgi:hypothetical protein